MVNVSYYHCSALAQALLFDRYCNDTLLVRAEAFVGEEPSKSDFAD